MEVQSGDNDLTSTSFLLAALQSLNVSATQQSKDAIVDAIISLFKQRLSSNFPFDMAATIFLVISSSACIDYQKLRTISNIYTDVVHVCVSNDISLLDETSEVFQLGVVLAALLESVHYSVHTQSEEFPAISIAMPLTGSTVASVSSKINVIINSPNQLGAVVGLWCHCFARSVIPQMETVQYFTVFNMLSENIWFFYHNFFAVEAVLSAWLRLLNEKSFDGSIGMTVLRTVFAWCATMFERPDGVQTGADGYNSALCVMVELFRLLQNSECMENELAVAFTSLFDSVESGRDRILSNKLTRSLFYALAHVSVASFMAKTNLQSVKFETISSVVVDAASLDIILAELQCQMLRSEESLRRVQQSLSTFWQEYLEPGILPATGKRKRKEGGPTKRPILGELEGDDIGFPVEPLLTSSQENIDSFERYYLRDRELFFCRNFLVSSLHDTTPTALEGLQILAVLELAIVVTSDSKAAETPVRSRIVAKLLKSRWQDIVSQLSVDNEGVLYSSLTRLLHAALRLDSQGRLSTASSLCDIVQSEVARLQAPMSDNAFPGIDLINRTPKYVAYFQLSMQGILCLHRRQARCLAVGLASVDVDTSRKLIADAEDGVCARIKNSCLLYLVNATRNNLRSSSCAASYAQAVIPKIWLICTLAGPSDADNAGCEFCDAINRLAGITLETLLRPFHSHLPSISSLMDDLRDSSWPYVQSDITYFLTKLLLLSRYRQWHLDQEKLLGLDPTENDCPQMLSLLTSLIPAVETVLDMLLSRKRQQLSVLLCEDSYEIYNAAAALRCLIFAGNIFSTPADIAMSSIRKVTSDLDHVVEISLLTASSKPLCLRLGESANRYCANNPQSTIMSLSATENAVKMERSLLTPFLETQLSTCPLLKAAVSSAVILVRACYLSYPELAVYTLGKLVYSWGMANNASDSSSLSIIYTDILCLARTRVLSSLYSWHPAEFVRKVYLPSLTSIPAETAKDSLDQGSLVLTSFSQALVEGFEESISPHLCADLLTELCLSTNGAIRTISPDDVLIVVGSIAIQKEPISRYLDSHPMVIFRLLMSEPIQSFHPTALECKRHLETQLQHSHLFLQVQYVSSTTFQTVLRSLVWELGNFSVAVKLVRKAICILGHIVCEQAWFTDDLQNMACRTAITTKEDVSLLLSSNFLYVVANILQQNYGDQSRRHHYHAVRAIQQLLPLLPAVHVDQYLPKISTVLDSALSSQSSKVRFSAVQLLQTLCEILIPNSLTQNLHVFVSYAFSVFDGKLDQPDSLIVRSRRDFVAAVSRPDFQTSQECLNLSCQLQLLFETVHAESVEKAWHARCVVNVVQLVTEIFVARRSQTEGILHKIVYFPHHTGFSAAVRVHRNILSAQSPSERLDTICSLLSHESIYVRRMALCALKSFLRENRDNVCRILLRPICTGLEITNDRIHNIFDQLLRMSSIESDGPTVLLCASCIGLIGAVDPSLRPISGPLLAGRKFTASLQASKSGAGWGNQNGNSKFIPPWEVQPMEFGLYLLQEHLVPSVKASSHWQDRSGFAVQSILQSLKRDIGGNEVDNFPQFPVKLRTALADADILEIVAPFWTTRYSMKDVLEPLQPPFYDVKISYTRWIGLWARFLGDRCHGPLTEYITACRGAVKTLCALSQFLLPYMIAITVTPTEESDAKINAEEHFSLVVDEICRVLQNITPIHNAAKRSLPSGGSAMAIQAVFDLLDTLSYWAQLPAMKQPQVVPAGGSRPSSAYIHIREMQETLKRLVAAIPQRLLSAAALKIKASARALRYFESFIRDNYKFRLQGCSFSMKTFHEKERGAGLAQRNDGSNGGLPRLTEADLGDLLSISSKVDVVDSVTGVLSQWLINGYSLNYRCRILDFEQREDWLRALSEYNSLHWLLTSDSERSDSCQLDILAEFKDIEVVEQGRLRCLIQLGQLESAIDQAVGAAKQRPQLEDALAHLGTEASWRLMKWESLSTFLSAANNDKQLKPFQDPEICFQNSAGSLLLDIYHQHSGANSGLFKPHMSLARREVMLCLASASKESYDRAYPYLVRLHILQEIEDIYEFNESDQQNAPSERVAAVNRLLSEERLRLLSSAPQHTALCLAIRRSLYGILALPQLVAQNWLAVSLECRRFSHFDAANLALRNAELWGLGRYSRSAAGTNDTVLLQECLILKEAGQVSKALELIESVETDAQSLRLQLEAAAASPDSRNMIAKKFHLATQLMVSGKLRLGRVIADRYALLTKLSPDSEDVHYEYGRYLESLYYELRQRDNGDNAGTPPSSSPRPRTPVGALEDMRQQQQQQQQNEGLSYRYVKQAIEMYCKCLSVGNSLAVQVLPRMLTLWLSFTALAEAGSGPESFVGVNRATNVTARAGASPTTLLANSQKAVNEAVFSASASIPAATWYTCTSQLVSRLGHCNSGTLSVITRLLERILTSFPDHAVWHIACLVKSLHADRNRVGQRLLEKAINTLMKNKQTDDAAMLKESLSLFSDLVRLAEELPTGNEKRIRFAIGRALVLNRFLVPTQSIMVNSPSREISGTSRPDLSSHCTVSNILRIAEFVEIVDVASSKARPKTVSLITTAGTTVRFLSKQEKDGDLRKDSRLMEFNCVVNRLLTEDAEGRRRRLGLRTYAVVCLNEECGLLEWVEHTRCIRHLIADTYKVWPDPAFAQPNMREIMQQLPDMQSRHRLDITALAVEYEDKIASKYRPCFHRWFLQNFEDATCWLEARTRFSRSAAVWSVVGHVIGLGDRHTENILLDVQNGECVHVDFDCLFDKGLSLQKPELVPFRLTPNMVDVMGLTGVEGIFRCTMEVALTVLRDHRDILLSVLEPFLRDPTVCWKRSGRAQRSDAATGRTSSGLGPEQDRENADAKAALSTISERLNGIYNISHPNADQICRAHAARVQANGSGLGGARVHRGIGAIRREEMALSVQGQVQRLIDEAIAVENLAQMFIGWMPWV